MSLRGRHVIGAVCLAAVALGPAAAPQHAPVTRVQDPLATDLTTQDLVMAANGCGTERWAVKTASDPDRNLVSSSQHPTTIDALRVVRPPSSLPSNGPGPPS